jgi:hypothetical protein
LIGRGDSMTGINEGKFFDCSIGIC